MKRVCSLPLDALPMLLQPPRASDASALNALHPVASAEIADDENDAHVTQLLQETEELLQSLESNSPLDLAESPGKPVENCDNKSVLLDSPTTIPDIEEPNGSPNAMTVPQDRKLQTPTASGPKKSSGGSKSKTVGNVTRDRLKAELAALRTQAAALESELQTAQHRRLTQWLTLATAAPPVWEQIAKRQKRGRESAEAENARLKRMLESQIHYVKGIEESLVRLRHFVTHQQPIVSLHPSGGSGGSGVLTHPTVRIERSDEVLYQMLLSELDEAYSRLGEVFYSFGIDTLSSARPFSQLTPKMELRGNGHLRSFVEKVDVKVSPFDFDLRTRVHWICSKRKNSTRNSVEYHKTAHLDDVVAGKFRARRVYNGAEVNLFILCAAKRFVLNDRVVDVWRALFKSEQASSSSSLFSDSYVQETGWSVATKLSEAGGGTIEKSVSHLEPKRFSSGLDIPIVTRAEADVMTTLVVDSYEDDTKDMDEMMENMLIEETFRYRK